MPRFFFHFTSQNDVSRDEVGTVFPSLEAAYLDSCQSALEMSIDKLRAREDPINDSVEIADESGRRLMNIPFAEVLRPSQKKRPTAMPDQMSEVNRFVRKLRPRQSPRSDRSIP